MNTDMKELNEIQTMLKQIKQEKAKLKEKIESLQCEQKDFSLKLINLIDKDLTKTFMCDCSGVYQLYLRQNTYNLDYMTVNSLRDNVLKNEINQDNPMSSNKIINLISANLFKISHAWLDGAGEEHELDDDEYEDLLRSPNYNPITGHTFESDVMYDEDSYSYVPTETWVMDQLIPLLRFSEELLDKLKSYPK